MKATNKQLAITQQQFQDFYKQKLRTIYQQLEPVRREKIQSAIIRTVITGIITLLIIGLCVTGIISQKTYESEGFFKICFALGSIAAYLIYEPFESYRTTTKNRVMKIILSFWGNFTYYHEKDIIGEPVIKNAELFTHFNKTEVDDAFSGHYKDVSLDVSEHNLRIHGNKGDTHVFKGVFIMLDFPKKFKGKTVAINKGRLWNSLLDNPLLMIPLAIVLFAITMPFYFMHGYYSGDDFTFSELLPIFIPLLIAAAGVLLVYWLWNRKNQRQATQKVALEGLSFMRRWKILTDNQVEARYILTPVFMEKMLEIKHLFHGKAIDFSFFDKKLLIAVHTRKNLFETTSLFVPALSYHKVREVISQLHSIFSVIDVVMNIKEK